MTPPWRAVIHQHCFGNATALKGFFQLLAHRCAVRAAVVRQSDQVAAMIVEHRQRSHWVRPSFRALEVHLPKLVGALTLEPLRCRRRAGRLSPDQIAAPQNVMNGVTRQLHPFSCQQHLQLACPPVGIARSQLGDPPLRIAVRAARTVMRLTTALGDSIHSLLPVTPQPQIPCRARDLIGCAQRRERTPLLRRLDYEPHALLL